MGFFNAFGQIKKVKDTNSVVLAEIGYNIVGMRTGLDDVDRGDWSFTPNALGEIVSQTDAMSQTIEFEYDKLGRPTERNEDEGTTTWMWGTSAADHNIGRLQKVQGPDCPTDPDCYVEEYEYDSAGRLDKRTISSDTTYVYDFAYNGQGTLHTLTYPTSVGGARFKLRYYYDHGINDAIRDYMDNVLGTTYWALNSVDQRGNPIDTDMGNGLSIISGFDPLTGLIDYTQSGMGGSTTDVQELSYEWNDAGRLTRRTDDRQSLEEEFFYDSMSRLDYSELNSTENLDLAYLQNGNIDSKDDGAVSNFVYDTNQIHAVISAGSSSFEYDLNGNAKKRNGPNITWTSYNKPSAINGSGESSSFSYAPDRSRWKQVATYSSGTETTIYAGGLLEKVTVGSLTSYKHLIYAPDGNWIQHVLRSDSSSDTFYVATDHLGSTDVIMEGSSVHVYTSFDAFGQRRDPESWDETPSGTDMALIASSTRRGFTGHEHLDNVELIHMNGRVQDPFVGRFLSADPFVQAPYSSESLNRYSYVFNSPLNFVDPTGFAGDDSVRYRIEPFDSAFRIINFLFGGPSTGVILPFANGILTTTGNGGLVSNEFGGGPGGASGGNQSNRPYDTVGQPDVDDGTISQTDARIPNPFTDPVLARMILTHSGMVNSGLGTLGYEASPGLDFGDPAVIAQSHVNQMLINVQSVKDPIADTANVIAATSGWVLVGGGAIRYGPVLVKQTYAGAQFVLSQSRAAYYTLRATSHAAPSAAETIAFHDAVLGAAGEAASVITGTSGVVTIEAQINVLAGQQIARQLAILGASGTVP